MSSNTESNKQLPKLFIPPRRRVLPDKIAWSFAEDQKLTQLVETYGSKHWSTIASQMKNRSGKQCRERWTHHLDPSVNRANWSASEEWMLYLQHKLYGNKWAILVKRLPGRTDNSVKNYWNSKMKKRLSLYSQKLVDAIKLLNSNPLKFEETFPAVEKDLILKISKSPLTESPVITNSEIISDKNLNDIYHNKYPKQNIKIDKGHKNENLKQYSNEFKEFKEDTISFNPTTHDSNIDNNLKIDNNITSHDSLALSESVNSLELKQNLYHFPKKLDIDSMLNEINFSETTNKVVKNNQTFVKVNSLQIHFRNLDNQGYQIVNNPGLFDLFNSFKKLIPTHFSLVQSPNVLINRIPKS